MQLTLSLDITPLARPITHTDNILLVGSCFTGNMAERLQQLKFRVLSNPHGILFNPLSVAHSINSYLDSKQYAAEDLFLLNELWNSWEHHTSFSNTDQAAAIEAINTSQQHASTFIRQADVVIITLGSAFQYYLADSGRPVSNNHRAPAQWFQKKLLSIDEIVDAMGKTLQKLNSSNPYAQVIFTISPVRHIRDGVVDNNRSKARLIEAVHTLCAQHEKTYYFPAYELIIDILRDYRYYDIDFVHPNYLATSFVWEQFTRACIAMPSQAIMQQVQDIVTARSHRTRFPNTIAHQKFKESYSAKVRQLLERYPYLDMSEEASYFSE